MDMSYRCCCVAAGMVFLPHSTRLHPSRVPSCSPASSSTKFDMLPLTVCACLERYRHDRCQCCRHVGTASAACSANVPHLRTTLWTSPLGCGVLLRSLSNQTPRSTCAGPVEALQPHGRHDEVSSMNTAPNGRMPPMIIFVDESKLRYHAWWGTNHGKCVGTCRTPGISAAHFRRAAHKV